MDIYEIRNALHSGKSIYDLHLRVTYYARVSTDKDAQLHSLSAQVQYYADLIRGCPAWTFVEGYVDEGLSGTSVGKRESFLRMIADAKAGQFDFILTKEISRFSRNTLDSIGYTQALLQSGVGVYFQSDNINTLMPDAELRLTIMSSIAQDEVRKTSERVKFGFRRAIEKGVVLGNSKIWGYEKKGGRLTVVEEEARMVRAIFDWYANRQMGIRAISQQLAEDGFQSAGGKPLSFSTIRGILANPKYKGCYCGGKTSKLDYRRGDRKRLPPEEWVQYEDPAAVPPLVPPELWEKANRLLTQRGAARKSTQHSGYQNKYAYSGKLICAQHGEPFYRSLYRYASGDKEVWQCRVYARKGRAGCAAPVLYTTELDAALRGVLDQVPLSKRDLADTLLHIYAAGRQDRKRQGEAAQRRAALATVEKRKDALLDLRIQGCISPEEFTLRNDRFNRELAEHKRCLEKLEEAERQGSGAGPDPDALQAAVERELAFPDGFDKGVVDALVEKVVIFPGAAGNQAELEATSRVLADRLRFSVRRKRGETSVCSVPYT